MWERTERVLRAQGIDPEAYLTGVRPHARADDRGGQARTRAARSARESVLEAVADAEGIEVSDEELLEALAGDGRARGHQAREAARAARRRPAATFPSAASCGCARAVDAIADSAQPIEPGKAKAREEIWTPEKQAKEEGSAQLWTPGSGDPPGRKAADAARCAGRITRLPRKLPGVTSALGTSSRGPVERPQDPAGSANPRC